MKVTRILTVAAVAMLCAATMANAAGRVWFDAVPGTPNAGVISPPGADKTELVCDTNGGLRCDWLIIIMYENFDGGAFGTSVDLGTLDPIDNQKFQIKQFQNSSNDLQVLPNASGTNLGNGWLVANAGGGNVTATGAPAGVYEIARFVLSKNKQPGLNQPLSTIWARIGSGEFGGNDGGSFYENPIIMGGQPLPGYGNFSPWPETYYGPVAVINVHNIPEPATIGMILAGAGVLVMARRRK